MRIRAKTLLAGPFGVITPGQEGDLPQAMAIPLIASGHAVSLEPPARKPVETATTTPPETAVTRTRKPKR